jgi:hypothetical protein
MPAVVELISLSELIAKVKSDLLSQVTLAGEDNPMLFVDGIEITAQVVAKREKGEGGKAGLSLSVLGFGTSAGIDTKTTVASQLTQAVTIKLSPLIGKAEYVEGLEPAEKSKVLGIVKQALVRGQSGGGEGEIA